MSDNNNVDLGIKMGPYSAHAKGPVKNTAVGLAVAAGLVIICYGGKKIIDYCIDEKKEQNKQATKTHDTNEAIRLEAERKRLKLKHEDDLHQQRLIHMKEREELKQQLAKAQAQSQPKDDVEEESCHRLLIPDTEPDEYAAEDYEDEEDGGVPELMGTWIHENDVSFIFAPTGVGKSILSMQLATDLARGVPIQAWPVAEAPKRQHVLYIDLEMMPKEQKQRYGSRLKDLSNFKTWHYYGKQPDKKSFFDRIAQYVDDIEERNILLLIDNLDKLINLWGADIAREVTYKMHTLVYKAKTTSDKEVTVVIVGHTRKKNTKNKGIDVDDLFGPSSQRNAGKAIITLEPIEGEEDYMMLKLLKNRNGATTTVKVRRFTKEQPGNWHFEMVPESPLESQSAPTPQPDSVLSQTQCTQEAASAMSPIASEMPYRLTADAFGKLNNSEKLAIYGLVKQELENNVTGKELSERMQRRLGVTVSPTIVSSIKTDKEGNMRKGYNDGGVNKIVVNKVRELYLSQNQ